MQRDTPMITIFNSENYDEWERATMFHLQAKLLSKVITEPKLTEASELRQWKRDNLATMGKIGERLDPEYYEVIRDMVMA